MSIYILTGDYVKRPLATAVPGARWAPEHRAFVVDDPTPRAALVALKLFPYLANEYPELVELRATLIRDVRPNDYATPYGKRIDAPRVQEVLDAKGWRLHDYQAIDTGYGADFLRANGGLYIAWERGLGKTLALCLLIDALDADATMVVCPNTLKNSVWGDALREFCPWLDVFVMPNSKPKRERLLADIEEAHAEGRQLALVTHYEALPVVAGKGKTPTGKVSIGDGWSKLGIDWLRAADEGHRLANPRAQFVKAFKKVPATGTVIMSGSVVQNHLEELYSPLNAMFPDRYKNRRRDWNDRYLDFVEGHGPILVGIKEGVEEQMRDELGVFMPYRRKADELDLPEKVVHRVNLELSSAQRKAYDELVETCLAELEDGSRIKAQAGAAMFTKLRQVATGLDLFGEVADSTKLDWAEEAIVDGEDDRFVVFSWYKAAVYALRDRLLDRRIPASVITGDQSDAERQSILAQFERGEPRVLIGTIATMGEGVNLQTANNVIFLDRALNPALNEQAEDRVHRQGQKQRVTVTHLIAKDTVDELVVMPTLATKEMARAVLLGGAA